MGAPLVFNTPVDRAVRASGQTREKWAEDCMLSTSTLMKARSPEEYRGAIHWTSLALIGMKMGKIGWYEEVDSNDPRLRQIARRMISTRGRGAPRFADRLNAGKPNLRLVS